MIKQKNIVAKLSKICVNFTASTDVIAERVKIFQTRNGTARQNNKNLNTTTILIYTLGRYLILSWQVTNNTNKLQRIRHGLLKAKKQYFGVNGGGVLVLLKSRQI